MRTHPTVSEVARNFSTAELRPVEVAKGPRLRDLPGILSSLPHLGSGDVKIVIELQEAQADRLQEEARRLGLRPEDLARIAVVDLLQREPNDLAGAAEYVLKKNGDYTQEREALFGDLSLDQILAAMKRQRP